MEIDLPIKTFKNQDGFEKWLEKNYANPRGIWLKFYKKSSGIKSIVYSQALDVALMFGWIDGQVRSLDEKAYIQRFTPRRSRSAWSQRNVEHIVRLTKLKKMRPAGFTAVAAAKKSGAWANAYHSPKTATVPKDFLIKLSTNKKAKDFYGTLSKSHLYTIYYYLSSAKKDETKQRRMKLIISKLAKKQKPSIF